MACLDFTMHNGEVISLYIVLSVCELKFALTVKIPYREYKGRHEDLENMTYMYLDKVILHKRCV